MTRDGQTGDPVLRYLRYLRAGGKLARFGYPPTELRDKFYRLKDRIMFMLHARLGGTDTIAYYYVPFLRRCDQCKEKASALYDVDDSHTWHYHLAMLPPCSEDVDVPERSAVAQEVRWQGHLFTFHIPFRKLTDWDLDVDRLPRRPWVPDEDFEEETTDEEFEEFDEIITILEGLFEQVSCTLEQYGTQQRTGVDVFVSYKSKDVEYARQLPVTSCAKWQELFRRSAFRLVKQG